MVTLAETSSSALNRPEETDHEVISALIRGLAVGVVDGVGVTVAVGEGDGVAVGVAVADGVAEGTLVAVAVGSAVGGAGADVTQISGLSERCDTNASFVPAGLQNGR